MVSATDLRTGMTVRIDGSVYLLTDCEHVKPGKGSAFSRIRLKHIHSGSIIDRTYKASDKVEDIRVERRDSQYQYTDGIFYYMMDMETYETFDLEIPEELKDQVKEGVEILYWALMGIKVLRQVK